MSLERAYRRLLAWYPAAHRREHQEEMLGVLLAAAPEGQRRPRPREAANLIGGALRIRLRRAPAEDRLAIWRDALALFSVIAPLLVLMMIVGVQLSAAFLSRVAYGSSLAYFALHLLIQGQLVLVILALLRLRRTAALVALAYTGLYVIIAAVPGSFNEPGMTFLLLITLCEAAALAASPGPRRGLALMGGPRLLLIPLAGVALAVPLAVPAGFTLVAAPGARAVAAAVLVMFAAGLGLASPLSRCLLLLFAIPGIPFSYLLAGIWPVPRGPVAVLASSPANLYLAGLYVLPLVITGLVVTAVLRARRRAVPGGTP